MAPDDWSDGAGVVNCERRGSGKTACHLCTRKSNLEINQPVMGTTVAYAPKISSGIEAVDEAWGGLYQGGSYLIYGRTASGRGLLPLAFAQSGVMDGQQCLYVTSGEFGGLAERARQIGFEMETWTGSGLLEIMQIPPVHGDGEDNDARLSRTLTSLVSAVETKRPQRLVIDSFMPFVAFRSFGRFRTSFISMLERIDATDATLFLTMAEPANTESEKVIEFMRNQTTASLHVELPDDDPAAAQRKLSLLPGIGHSGHAAVKLWTVPSPPPVTEGGRSRRFRFAEESTPEQETVSLVDAQWDAQDTEIGGEFPPPRKEMNGSSHGATAEDATVASFKLGVPTAKSAPLRAKPQPAPEIEVPAVPLGRLRQKSAVKPDDQPFTETLTTGRSNGPTEDPFHAYVSTPETTVELHDEDVDTSPEAPTHTDREAFRARLQHRFLRSSVNDIPFLLIAMRMDRREEISSRPFDFEFILDLVNELMREQDDMYVDLERERLIVMLADTDAEGSRPFFAELRRRLREEAPHQADHLLQSVSAIVVPNGRPFQNAEEFLSYALGDA